MRERVDLKSPVRENRPPGSVRGAPGNRRPYRDPTGLLRSVVEENEEDELINNTPTLGSLYQEGIRRCQEIYELESRSLALRLIPTAAHQEIMHPVKILIPVGGR